MLRRFFCGILTAVTIFVFLTSCAEDSQTPTDYQNTINGASVTFDYGVTTYSADIVFDGDIPDDTTQYRPATVTFTSPEELTGLVLKYTSDSATASIGKVSLDLPKNTGNEVYMIVRLFSMYPEEIFEEETDVVKFRTDMFGKTVTYEVFFDGDDPSSANISWDNGQIKVTKITVS